jgi:hypothetical protein
LAGGESGCGNKDRKRRANGGGSMNSINMESGKNFPIQQMPSQQREVDALKHLIHKLRWMGLEEEAETVCVRLSRLSPAATLMAGLHETD